MKVPVSLRIAALAVATTGFYTYVGQLVPQKEVHPPEDIVLAKDMKPEEMQKVGRQIMEGKGLCFTCHTIGKSSGPFRFPDLGGIGSRAGTRIPGMSDVEYIAQSMYEPAKFIVPGFNPGMPEISKPPIGLTDDEILAVIAYLQSLGGTTTVTMQTKLPWQAGGGGDAAIGATPPAAPATPADTAPAATPGATDSATPAEVPTTSEAPGSAPAPAAPGSGQ
ncbi:MAG: cytochrome c [Acidobacteriota bacterium]